MALMDKVQRLSTDCITSIFSYYEEKKLPVALRSIYAKEIEQAVCGSDFMSPDASLSGLDPSDPFTHEHITRFIRDLVEHLRKRLSGQEDPIPLEVRPQLTSAFPEIQVLCQSDPVKLFGIIRECIQFEIALVLSQEPGVGDRDLIMDSLTQLKRKVLGVTETLGKLEAEQSALGLHLTESTNLEDASKLQEPTSQQRTRHQQLATIIQGNITSLQQLQSEFKIKCKQNIEDLWSLQTLIVNEKIKQWKYQQQRLMNGTAIPEMERISLDRLQAWCEELAGLIWTTYQRLNEFNQIKAANAVMISEDVTELREEVVKLLTQLLNQSFLIENQPPQVMKKGTRFPTALTVVLLVGHKLNIQMTPPSVQTCIITESQAKGLQERVADGIKPAGEIVNGTSRFEFSSELRRLVAHFRSIQLKRIERAEKRTGAGNECVMEEKFCLFFESVVNVGDLKIRIQTMSLPVVVTSHGSQEAQAVATIMWDNAFGNRDRTDFSVPNSVSWAELSQVISDKFAQVTGRGLSEDHLRFLKQKAFRSRSHTDTITWSEFCKDHLPPRTFTFWDWVHGALRVLEKKENHLKEMWREGLITGFIDKDQAVSRLSVYPAGNFLLRFSDSCVGAITIVWVHVDGIVHHVQPFLPLDLQSKRLADRVKELRGLSYLYPGIPKSVFDKFASEPKKPSTSAVRSGGPPYVPIVPSLEPCTSSGVASDGNNSVSSTPPTAGSNSMGFTWTRTPCSPDGSDRSRASSFDNTSNHYDMDVTMDGSSSSGLQARSPLIPAIDQLRSVSPYSMTPNRSPGSPNFTPLQPLSPCPTSNTQPLSPNTPLFTIGSSPNQINSNNIIQLAFNMAADSNAQFPTNAEFEAQFQDIEGILNGTSMDDASDGLMRL